MTILPFALYILTGLLHLGGILLGQPLTTTITKPLLLPLLAWALISQVPRLSSAFAKAILVAFFFSWLGDILLMRSGSTIFFLTGLGAFLIAQLSYILAFWNFPPRGFGLIGRRKWLVIPFLMFWILMLRVLWPGLAPEFQIPVMLYSLALVSMGVFAVGMGSKVAVPTGPILVGGALLFILSDSCIALDRFADLSLWEPRFLIMSTYIAAQGLLALGSIRALRKEH